MYNTTLTQNCLRNYYFYSKFTYYNHQQPSSVDKYDVMFICASCQRRLLTKNCSSSQHIAAKIL